MLTVDEVLALVRFRHRTATDYIDFDSAVVLANEVEFLRSLVSQQHELIQNLLTTVEPSAHVERLFR